MPSNLFANFKTFLLRAPILELATAVVIGTAFTALVTAFTSSFITPLISLLVGPDNAFSGLAFTFHGILFPFYQFIDKFITFFLTAAILFFFVLAPVNHFLERAAKNHPPAPSTKTCPECLSEIALLASRCAFCGQPQPPRPASSLN